MSSRDTSSNFDLRTSSAQPSLWQALATFCLYARRKSSSSSGESPCRKKCTGHSCRHSRSASTSKISLMSRCLRYSKHMCSGAQYGYRAFCEDSVRVYIGASKLNVHTRKRPAAPPLRAAAPAAAASRHSRSRRSGKGSSSGGPWAAAGPAAAARNPLPRRSGNTARSTETDVASLSLGWKTRSCSVLPAVSSAGVKNLRLPEASAVAPARAEGTASAGQSSTRQSYTNSESGAPATRSVAAIGQPARTLVGSSRRVTRGGSRTIR
mmetsp:Transcript_99282/g.258881  ORF Transcript_99282/g.258881 Transcript_99282/m.258881 type:complete len:266 (-) Transcript_99282:322-1119(-)